MFLKALILPALLLTTVPAIPPENQTKGASPSQHSAEAGAEQLLTALKTGDPAPAADFFFPAAAFDQVKDLPVPARYHEKLVRWYREDIQKEHARFKKGEWAFEKLEMGRCKWKAIGTEGNKLPYWSCTRNFVTATDGSRKRRFEIRVLINWGQHWYVTHLGPIRK